MKSDEKTLRKYYMDKDYSFPSSCPANFSQTTAVRKSERQQTHMKMQKKEEVLGYMIRTARKVYDEICKQESDLRKQQTKTLWQENRSHVEETNKNIKPPESTWIIKESKKNFDENADEEANYNSNWNFCVNYANVEIFREDFEELGGKKRSTPIITIEALAPIPPVLDWTSIPFNIQVEDGKYLTNIPFLGDHVIERDLRFLDEVVGHYKGKIHQEHHECKNKLEDEHFLTIVSKVRDAKKIRTRNQSRGMEDDTEPPEAEEGKINQIVTRMGSLRKSEEIQEVKTEEKLNKICIPNNNPPQLVFSAISKAFKGIGNEIELKQRYEGLLRKNGCAEEVPSGKEKISPIPVPNIDGESSTSLPRESSLCSYHSLFCRRCYKYDCQQHAEEDHVASKYLRKTPAALEQVFGECQTENCWRKKELNFVSNRSRREIRLDWTPSERSLFRSLIDPFQKNYCAIADIIVTKNCREVFEFAKTEDNPREIDKTGAILEKVRKRNKKYIVQTKASSSASKRRGTRRWINNFKKAEKYPVSSDLEKGSSLGELPARFVPCIHEDGGECDIHCQCRKNKTACEKFCTCSLNCANRFPGCRCTSTCDSKRCICFAASRECDPDLCFGCGAHEMDINNMTCRNANIQRKLDKHLLWGPSDVSGWGIFLKFNALKNDFISEYRGELVSQEEADRRGLVYDKVQHTFLFELNDHFVIDATRKGNKTRFANSSKTPNCFAKRMLVNGDHRIGIYAKRNIDSGEELFYDYENVLEKQAKTTTSAYTASTSSA